MAAERRRLTTAEAADYLLAEHDLRRAPRTLRKLRCEGGGPRFSKLGNLAYYDRTDLDAWARSILSAAGHPATHDFIGAPRQTLIDLDAERRLVLRGAALAVRLFS